MNFDCFEIIESTSLASTVTRFEIVKCFQTNMSITSKTLFAVLTSDERVCQDFEERAATRAWSAWLHGNDPACQCGQLSL